MKYSGKIGVLSAILPSQGRESRCRRNQLHFAEGRNVRHQNILRKVTKLEPKNPLSGAAKTNCLGSLLETRQRAPRSREDLFDNLPMDIRQTKVASLKSVRQTCVIKSEQMQ